MLYFTCCPQLLGSNLKVIEEKFHLSHNFSFGGLFYDPCRQLYSVLWSIGVFKTCDHCGQVGRKTWQNTCLQLKIDNVGFSKLASIAYGFETMNGGIVQISHYEFYTDKGFKVFHQIAPQKLDWFKVHVLLEYLVLSCPNPHFFKLTTYCSET